MSRSAPRIALVMGDAAGVGAELAARLLARSDETRKAGVLVVGSEPVLLAGARIAGVDIAIPIVRDPAGAAFQPGRPELFDPGHDGTREIPLGAASREGGAFAMRNFGAALDLGRAGLVDAICFTPFNKLALKLAGNPHLDEIHWAADRLGFRGRCSEYNRLDRLWNARVTSHVPLREVASLLTRGSVLESVVDADRTIRRATAAAPRIAVAGLNPHAGEGGLFGREEIDIIAPAVAEAHALGLVASGPYPADTVWLRAVAGEFDAVVTMYHDQGQIALKLLGFNRGVTILGGLPLPICTPAHGTAYDIAGQGRADPGATCAAFATALAMAEASRAEAPSATS